MSSERAEWQVSVSCSWPLMRIWSLLLSFALSSVWKQGQNSDCDGVCQPWGSVWLHLWQEAHLWAGGQAFLQANSVSCALLPPGETDFSNQQGTSLQRGESLQQETDVVATVEWKCTSLGKSPPVYVKASDAELRSDWLLGSLLFFLGPGTPKVT